jgi:hypothetical protein
LSTFKENEQYIEAPFHPSDLAKVVNETLAGEEFTVESIEEVLTNFGLGSNSTIMCFPCKFDGSKPALWFVATVGFPTMTRTSNSVMKVKPVRNTQYKVMTHTSDCGTATDYSMFVVVTVDGIDFTYVLQIERKAADQTKINVEKSKYSKNTNALLNSDTESEIDDVLDESKLDADEIFKELYRTLSKAQNNNITVDTILKQLSISYPAHTFTPDGTLPTVYKIMYVAVLPTRPTTVGEHMKVKITSSNFEQYIWLSYNTSAVIRHMLNRSRFDPAFMMTDEWVIGTLTTKMTDFTLTLADPRQILPNNKLVITELIVTDVDLNTLKSFDHTLRVSATFKGVTTYYDITCVVKDVVQARVIHRIISDHIKTEKRYIDSNSVKIALEQGVGNKQFKKYTVNVEQFNKIFVSSSITVDAKTYNAAKYAGYMPVPIKITVTYNNTKTLEASFVLLIKPSSRKAAIGGSATSPTLAHLKVMARKAGIKGRSTMNKAELVVALEASISKRKPKKKAANTNPSKKKPATNKKKPAKTTAAKKKRVL